LSGHRAGGSRGRGVGWGAAGDFSDGGTSGWPSPGNLNFDGVFPTGARLSVLRNTKLMRTVRAANTGGSEVLPQSETLRPPRYPTFALGSQTPARRDSAGSERFRTSLPTSSAGFERYGPRYAAADKVIAGSRAFAAGPGQSNTLGLQPGADRGSIPSRGGGLIFNSPGPRKAGERPKAAGGADPPYFDAGLSELLGTKKDSPDAFSRSSPGLGRPRPSPTVLKSGGGGFPPWGRRAKFDEDSPAKGSGRAGTGSTVLGFRRRTWPPNLPGGPQHT